MQRLPSRSLPARTPVQTRRKGGKERGFFFFSFSPFLLVSLSVLLVGGTTQAQVINGNLLPSPRLTYVTPFGAKAGSMVELGFAGSDLENPEALWFSHPGIKATPVIPPPPKPDPKKPNEKPPQPPVTRFTVTVAPDVPRGFHDVRLVNKWGVSNPRVFVVGDLNEVTETEPNNDIDQAQKVEIGTTINGIMNSPTDVDYCVFAGRKGQRLNITCLAGGIDSRFHPELKLFDTSGRQLAYYRPLPGHDAVLDVILPEEGNYFLRLCQFTHVVGNPEYFYRLSISTVPRVDLVWPPLVEPGKTAQVIVYGRGLPGGQPAPELSIDGRPLEKIMANITAPGDPLAPQRLTYSGTIGSQQAMVDGFEYRLQTPQGLSNPQLLLFAEAPVVLDNFRNDSPEQAQAITLPCDLAGLIEKQNDRDWYSFTAKKGDVYIIEAMSHKLGSATDLYLSLRQPTDKGGMAELAFIDDDQPSLTPKEFYTGSRDPAPLRWVAPADGKFFLVVGSHPSATSYGADHVYRVRITPEKPDFRLFVMPPDTYRPDGLWIGQGGNEAFNVYAWRRDGFRGEIKLEIEGLPTGVTAKPQILGPGVKQTALVLTAKTDAPIFTGQVKVKGTAIINGKPVVREARPASITWPIPQGQVFPTMTRLDRTLMLAVRDKAPYVLTPTAEKAVVSHGDKVDITVKTSFLWAGVKAAVQIQPLPQEMPPGMTFAALTIPADKNEGKLTVTTNTNIPPGKYNLVLRSFAPVPFNKDPNAKQKPNVNVVQSSAPIELTVLPKQVAQLAVDNANPTIKKGMQGVVTVRVTRQFDYAGEFKVKLVLPPGTQGVSATDGVIPPGQNEAKLTILIPPTANPGARPNLSVQAVAVVNGNVTLTHEVKINVNVVN